MKLENQVCSLELAKKLKGLGVSQESLFYWDDTADIISGNDFTIIVYEKRKDEEHYYSAFTVAELGEMLPNSYCSYGRETDWRCVNHLDEKVAGYGDTEADARAKCLIYLLENNLLEN